MTAKNDFTYTDAASPANGMPGNCSDGGMAASNAGSMPDYIQVADIFRAIFNKLNQLYNIDCAGLIIYNAALTKIRVAYIIETGAQGLSEQAITDELELNAVAREIADFQFPVLKTRQEWEQEYDINHCVLNNNADYNFHCYIPLEYNDQMLGTLELHNSKRGLSADGLNFCSSIADLLADIVNRLVYTPARHILPNNDTPINTIINQEVKPNNQPGADEILLAFGKALGAINNRTDFIKVVGRLFKQFTPLSDFAISTININDSKVAMNTILFGSSTELLKSTAYVKVFSEDSNRTNLINAFVTANESVVTRINDLPVTGNEYLIDNGFIGFIETPLKNAGSTIGVLQLYVREEACLHPQRVALVDAVSSMLSTALANVLLNEKNLNLTNELNYCTGQLEEYLAHVIEPVEADAQYPEIIGHGEEMRRVFNLLNQVAASDSTVLILGDTGTGKELIANAIHGHSQRNGKPFIKVNCAAIPANLIESELFGHEKGSFTGAAERRIGKFEAANNGTLFLDEIGELPLDLQVKLLRVLQEKEIERIGSTTTIKTNVRVIAATNRSLFEEVEAGKFRRDLFYRLNVFPINLPSLRNRAEDIPLLADHFLKKFVKKTGRNIAGFSQRALKDLIDYHWPGNVREMEHLIERQVLLTKTNLIKTIQIPSSAKGVIISDDKVTRIKTIDENERDHIFAVLKSCKGKVSGPFGAAKLLGVPATTLNSKIKRLGLTKKHLY